MTEQNAKEKLHSIYLLSLVLSLVFQAMAVVLGKTAALRMGSPTVIAFVTNPWYLGSLACLIFQAVFWQLVLRKTRLFVAYLFTSMNYFLVLAASHFLFLEPVTTLNLIGAAVIVGGVYLVAQEDLS